MRTLPLRKISLALHTIRNNLLHVYSVSLNILLLLSIKLSISCKKCNWTAL